MSPRATTPFPLELLTLLKNCGAMLGAQTLSALLQLGAMVLVAKHWGPAGNGAWVVALLLPTLLTTFFNLGINAANVYYLGAQRFSLRQVLATNGQLFCALAVAGLVAGAILIGFFGERVFPGIEARVLWLALASYPLSLALVLLSSVFQGLQQFKRLNLVMLTQPALLLAAVTLMVLAGVTQVAWLVSANLLALGMAVALAALFLRRAVPVRQGGAGQHAMPPDYGMDKACLQYSLSYGHKVYLSNLLTLLQSRADIFLVNLLINPAAAGIYAIAFQLGEKVWMLSHAISMVILPRLSELEGNERRRIEITTIVSRMVLAASAVGALLAAALAWPLIGWLFGEQYHASYLPFVLLLPGIVALSSARVIANDIAARGRPELNLYMAACAAFLSIAGNWLVLPHFGILGAAVVTSTVYCIDLLLKMLAYKHLTHVSFTSLLCLRRGDLRDVHGALNKRRPQPA